MLPEEFSFLEEAAEGVDSFTKVPSPLNRRSLSSRSRHSHAAPVIHSAERGPRPLGAVTAG